MLETLVIWNELTSEAYDFTTGLVNCQIGRKMNLRDEAKMNICRSRCFGYNQTTHKKHKGIEQRNIFV